MPHRLLNTLLFFPSRHIGSTPAASGLAFEDMSIPTADGETLHGWWISRRAGPPLLGHVLLFHGNAGNVEARVLHAVFLTAQGFDVLLLDYRGYGRSTGKPSEAGTRADARAARTALLGRSGIDLGRVFYLGESLGGGVAVELAVAHPPRGLVLQSSFTSVHALADLHYPVVPRFLVPDAYPSERRMRELRAPVLVLHGDQDDIVPIEHGRALFAAAPEPKRMHVVPGAGHNDLLYHMGESYGRVIGDWARGLAPAPR
jgi:uncharacterized protein